ncbi:MAG: capsule assembly Wzi family protein, partial [Phycisphaerales bacterium]|nr:capsule assembly Wzi family protein [Phycisphaerales bacterium]
PALSLDRESSAPFESKWLRWIGPWRLTTFMGRMEDERQDIDHPLLFGMRIAARPFGNVRFGSARPFNGLELALERTAQWCGEGLPCDLNAFWNMFTGNDNAVENVDPEDEPGNQLGGWAVRWTSPIGSAPYALYFQRTGESFSQEAPPRQRRSLDLIGAEIWGARDSGTSWRVHAEFAGTACAELDRKLDPIFDCAYNNSLFNVEGYRYRGRPIGASTDGDSRSYTLGLQISTPQNVSGSLLFRFAELNRGGVVPDTRNTVARGPVDLWNVETGVRIPTRFGDLNVGLGFDQATDELTDRVERAVRGFAELRNQF